MHQSRIRDIIVIDISKQVDIYDNLICVTEAEGLGIILVNCRLFATLVQQGQDSSNPSSRLAPS